VPIGQCLRDYINEKADYEGTCTRLPRWLRGAEVGSLRHHEGTTGRPHGRLATGPPAAGRVV